MASEIANLEAVFVTFFLESNIFKKQQDPGKKKIIVKLLEEHQKKPSFFNINF